MVKKIKKSFLFLVSFLILMFVFSTYYAVSAKTYRGTTKAEKGYIICDCTDHSIVNCSCVIDERK